MAKENKEEEIKEKYHGRLTSGKLKALEEEIKGTIYK